MPEIQSSRAAVLLAFALVYLVWGSTYLGIRIAIESLPPLLMAGTRFLTAGSLLLAFGLLRGQRWPSPAEWRASGILGLLMLLGGNGGVTLAEKHVPSGITALLVATEPLWLVLLNAVRPGGAAPTRWQVAGLFLGFVGTGFLVVPKAGAESIHLGGAALVMGAAITWAIGSLYAIDAARPKSPSMANGSVMFLGGVSLFLSGLIAGEGASVQPSQFTNESLLALAYLTIFGAIVGFSAYTYLLKHTSPAKASTYAYVNPVVAVLLGWWLLGEPVGTRAIGAMCLIVAAVALMSIKPRVPAKPGQLAENGDSREELCGVNNSAPDSVITRSSSSLTPNSPRR